MAADRGVGVHRVINEGADLCYEVRGQGKPLLMIAGGGGDSWWYTAVADVLADEYKVIVYDRRGNSRSKLIEPENFEVSQQSRDAIAVLNAAGEESAYVVGSSGGSVVALDIAKSHPQAARAVIVHEPPTARVLPDAEKWQRLFAEVHWLASRFGVAVGALRFALAVGVPIRAQTRLARAERIYRAASDEDFISTEDANEFWAKHQLLPTANYLPNVERIKHNGVTMFMAAGKISLDGNRFYARTAQVLARQLECEFVTFPGHHIAYWDMPDQWAATLRDVVHSAEATATN